MKLHMLKEIGTEFLFARSLSSLNETINYIEKNYDEISKKFKKINYLPKKNL